MKATPNVRRRIFRFMNSGPVQLFLMALLMISLFLAESWVAGNAPNSADQGLNVILVIVFIIFMLESFILSFVQEGYFLSFFFCMDVLGTFSILLDISWVADPLFQGNSSKHSSSQVLRATRAAKLAARYGRLMRLLKLLRFLKYLPCFAQKEEEEPTMSAVRKTSNELSNMLSLRVAMLVMLLVIVVPFLSYTTVDFSPTAWMTMAKMTARNPNSTTADIEHLGYRMWHYYSYKDTKLYHLHIDSPNHPAFDRYYPTHSVVRKDNLVDYISQYTSPGSSISYSVRLTVDLTTPNRMDANFGIILVVLVILCLVGFSASFQVRV